MLWQQIVNGLTLGMVYALIAVGYSLVFGILRLMNMAHGSVYAFGAHMALMILGMNFGMVPAVIGAIILTGILNIIIDRGILAPLRNRKAPNITGLISVVGVSYIIQNMLMLVFGSQKKLFPKLFDLGIIHIGGVEFTATQMAIALISIILLVVLTVVIRYTRIGLAMRAAQKNTLAAKYVGIDVRNVISFTFFLGGVSAAIAGVLISGYYEMVYSTMGTEMGLRAFSAAVLGGIGVLHGSVVGGIIVGVAEALAVTFLGGTFKDATAFIILFLVLLIRPTGLFGKENINKV